MTEQYNKKFKLINGTQRSITDLESVIESYFHYRIKRRSVPLNGANSSIRGFYLACDDGSYEIYLLDSMNYCWNRFVLCKELFHVIIDDEQYRNIEIFAHLEEVVTKFYEPNSRPGLAAVSELLAEAAAMEFMFPYTERMARLSEVAPGGQPDYRAIAEMYKVPQYYVEKYLAVGWIGYIGAFHK